MPGACALVTLLPTMAHDADQPPAIRRITPQSAAWPPSLLHIYEPPAALWLRGAATEGADLLRRPAIGIVGARDCTSQGAAVARRLGRELAAAGFVVVSGLAVGIDAAAHEGALEVEGATVAVLGCGPDQIYPWPNRRLRRRLLEQALLVSEFEPGMPPLKHHFPQRNRILSGLCVGVVVVEGREHSGSGITARHALEQGREVMAVPAPPLHPRGALPNRLLKEGAALVENLDDIIAALPDFADALDRRHEKAMTRPMTHRGTLLGRIREGAETVDDLARGSGKAVAEIQRELFELELAGQVRRGSDGRLAPV